MTRTRTEYQQVIFLTGTTRTGTWTANDGQPVECYINSDGTRTVYKWGHKIATVSASDVDGVIQRAIEDYHACRRCISQYDTKMWQEDNGLCLPCRLGLTA